MASRARSSRQERPTRSLVRPATARTAGSGLRLVTEGFETRDLKEAKKLLDELHA